MVCVYLALGVLMVLRLAAAPVFARRAVQWALVGAIAFDYLAAPIPLTALDRPAVYEQLATIRDYVKREGLNNVTVLEGAEGSTNCTSPGQGRAGN